MIHLVCAWQLPKSEKEDAEVFKAAGATTIAAPTAPTPGPVPEADPASDTAAPHVTAAAPAETAVPAPVPTTSADPALPPALDSALAPALDAALAPALDADAPADGDASVTADAIDTNNANPPQLQLESALPPSQATQQAAALIRDQARRIHINSH